MSSLYRFSLIVSVLYLLQPSLQSNITIDLRIESGQINVGGLAKFTCNVTGAEVASFMWKHNGVVISSDDTTIISPARNGNVGELTIHDIPLEKAGNYTCIPTIDGAVTSVKKSVVLTLVAPPTILAEPSQYAVLQNNVEINCTFTGKGVSMLWMKDGMSITSNERYDTSILGFLKFENANLSDTGNYTCRASNNVGSDSKTILFTVLTFPKFTVRPATTTNVRSQGQTILTCKAMGINTPTISWRVGGVDVESLNSSRLASYENGSLVINDTKFEDNSKSYSCMATNRADSMISTTNLNVTGFPEFTMPPQNTTVAIGRSVEIVCAYEAIPLGERQWTKIDHNGMPTKIDSTYSDRYQIADNGSLMISMTSDEDNGQFSCTVLNALGNVSEVIQLTVISPPNAPEEFEGTRSAGQRTFTVVWQKPTIADATHPVDKYIITIVRTSSEPQEERTINVPNNQTRFSFTDLLPGNDYTVSAAAYNEAGSSKSTQSVKFSTIPTVPSLSSLVASESENIAAVEFKWSLDYDGGHEITSFSIEYSVVNSDPPEIWTSLNAPGLDVTAGRYTPLILPPKEEYEFRVIVENMLGRGVFKFPGTFTVREAVPGQPSKPVSSEITTGSITVSLMFEFLGTGGIKQFRVNITGDGKETRTITATAYSSTVLLTIDGLESDSTYSFTVAAENDIGVGPYSEMSDAITTEKNLTVYYIIAGVVGGLVIVAVIVVATLFICYLCNKKRMTKHQISNSVISIERKEIQVMDTDEMDFVSRYERHLPHHFNSGSDILPPNNPVERSLSLQAKNTHTASTISYSSSNHPNRSASLSQPCRSNGFVPMPMAHNQMFSSATVISYGSGSHVGSYTKHWSPSSESIPASTSRERRSPSSNYNSDTLGSRITNLATDV